MLCPADFADNRTPRTSARPAPSRVQRVVLTGFMGSGKTTVGRLLAAELGWSFCDLDHEIERQLGIPVPQIFALHGEAAFRQAELQALREQLEPLRQVIALGGGAPSASAVRELLQSAPETLVIHLQTSFAVQYERCRLQALDAAATTRPLLGDAQATEARYLQRMPFYVAVAHWEADASSPPAALAASLAALLRRSELR